MSLGQNRSCMPITNDAIVFSSSSGTRHSFMSIVLACFHFICLTDIVQDVFRRLGTSKSLPPFHHLLIFPLCLSQIHREKEVISASYCLTVTVDSRPGAQKGLCFPDCYSQTAQSYFSHFLFLLNCFCITLNQKSLIQNMYLPLIEIKSAEKMVLRRPHFQTVKSEVPVSSPYNVDNQIHEPGTQKSSPARVCGLYLKPWIE